ncbi:class I tRNA ligase family protein [Proteiniborus sp. MB09-C3]|uniref:class I tRNA ligase family protein n=1 Tax=Proteiniborus sp. MB09-C3 TaxID=3050072 RepID=UPI0025539E02|nr:class I tRNA ligase family protein [Proteiniborus sp. MB09-C3]WIV13888.1 class I tRNA ligase family protein [Proteiniborus sp. MB09-C3]
MNDSVENNTSRIDKSINNISRPQFPRRAVVTAGMPYGNKELHLGHIGGVFVHADTFARFLRDRIGRENVIFVSGTDCYGSPISENYRQLVNNGKFKGTINDFVQFNHERQKEVLEHYNIDLNLFAASSFGPSSEVHKQVSSDFFQNLYSNGHLTKMTTSQFYDTDFGVFLNGRQVIGKCPIEGCSSEKAYADECSLGHQYMPINLINPKSTLSGKKPEMRDVTNWYFNLDNFHDLLEEWINYLEETLDCRPSLIRTIKEFLKPPVIYVKKDQFDLLNSIQNQLPQYILQDEDKKSSFVMIFNSLGERDKACLLLGEKSIRFRTGKTLVPFRLTGNVEWGVPVPSIEGIDDLTFWVWPESLWAPISFTKTYLKQLDKNDDAWRNWWCSSDSSIYQFMGEDNIYFYGPAEMAMFMATQGRESSSHPSEGQLQLPNLVANNHILFLDKKASSSGNVKPPTAKELLNYYTSEQLRAHFLGLGLGIRSVSFQPKPFNPKASEKDSDPVLKEGNLLTNVFNRVARSCFYTVQQYYNGKIPVGNVSEEVLYESQETILEFERLMHRYEFHTIMNLMDSYIRNINKSWVRDMKLADENKEPSFHSQVVVDAFHRLRTAMVLMHSIAPEGTEMILEYLNLGEEFWSWEKIFHTIYDFMDDPQEHCLKFLEPRIDFFKKHPSQFV